MAKPQPQAHQIDLTIVARYQLVAEISKTVRTALVFGSAVLVVYSLGGMVHDLAGKKTAADIGMSLFGTLEVSEGLAWAIAAICGGVVFKTRRTNSSMAKRLDAMSALERSIDPNRSSSHLTDTGMPREEDI